MLSNITKPSKSAVVRSLQRTKESDISIFEPITTDSLKKVSDDISKIVRSAGFVSIIVIKCP